MKERMTHRKTQRFLGLIMALLLLAVLPAGCVTMPPPEPPTVDRGEMQPPRPARVPLSELRPLADIAPRAAMEESMPFEDKLFSLSVMDAQLQEAILPIAEAANLNLVFDRGVNINETVSVRFRDLSLRQAMSLILNAMGYYYQVEGNVLRVKALETRHFTLDYSLLASSPSSSVGSDQFSVDATAEEDDVKVWQILEEALGVGTGATRDANSLLSEQGSGQINKMAGLITVTDRPENLERVAAYLKALEKALRRQVLIEAKIVEVTLRSGHQYGIDWSMVRTRLGRTGFEIGSAMAPTAGTFSLDFFSARPGSDANPINVVLRALASEGNVNVLSSPRLNVLNNQSGLINFQTAIPYFQWEVRNVGTADNPRYEPVPTVVFADEGVSLGITPQISADGYVNLAIVPVVSKRTDTATLNYQGSNYQIPVMSVRESSTMIRVADGGTVVLGGIIEESTEDLRDKIPVLGDIPGLGRLFSSQERSVRKTELVVLVTATVVEH